MTFVYAFTTAEAIIFVLDFVIRAAGAQFMRETLGMMELQRITYVCAEHD